MSKFSGSNWLRFQKKNYIDLKHQDYPSLENFCWTLKCKSEYVGFQPITSVPFPGLESASTQRPYRAPAPEDGAKKPTTTKPISFAEYRIVYSQMDNHAIRGVSYRTRWTSIAMFVYWRTQLGDTL